MSEILTPYCRRCDKTLTKPQHFLFYALEYLMLFVLGGFIYYMIEICFRGYSHPSMFILGGICFILIGLINEVLPWDMLFWWQLLIGDIIVLVLEFVTGCIVNLYLGWNIWDYSDMPFNLMGQICLPFALLWLPVIAVAIVLDDYCKYLFFHGEKPHYRFK